MKEFKLKVSNSEFVAESLGISGERSKELGKLFLEAQMATFEKRGDDVSITDIILEISNLDITPEEYTFLVFSLGAQTQN